jgi:hypothetical protein
LHGVGRIDVRGLGVGHLSATGRGVVEPLDERVVDPRGDRHSFTQTFVCSV